MELESPIYFYGLLAVVLLVGLYGYNAYWRSRQRKAFGDWELFRQLAPEYSPFKRNLKHGVQLLAIVCIVIALVNPRIGTSTETVKREGIDIVFAMDVSKSMLAEDVAPSRMEKSKQLVNQIMTQLAGDRIGIVAYAGSAFPVLPITTDYSSAKMFLQSMNTDLVSSQGTALSDALEMATNMFEQGSATSKLIILVTDGEDHEANWESAAQAAADAGIKILTIGLGTEKGGPIPIRVNGQVREFKRDKNDEVVITKRNAENLAQIGQLGSGGYVSGNQTKDVLDYVKNALANIERTEFETQEFTDYNSQFQWFLGLGILLLIVDLFFLNRKTEWIRRLNLFNEK